jgi:hypothetical protein
MALKVGISGQGRNLISDLKLMACKMSVAEYTVVLANQKSIDILRSENLPEKMILIAGPTEDNQCYVITDEMLKYSILSGKGIIEKCDQMERLLLGNLIYQGREITNGEINGIRLERKI